MKISVKFLSGFSALVLLSGCVTNTVSELRNDTANFDGSIDSDRNAQQVYRSLRDMAKSCLEHAPMGTPVTTEGEFDGDLKNGQIRQRMVAQNVLLNMTVIDVTSVSDSKSLVKLYSVKGWLAIGTNIPKTDDIARWANGDSVCWKTGNKT